MTLEQYRAGMQELGVDRGFLGDGKKCPDDPMARIVQNRQSNADYSRAKASSATPQEFLYDLSHLNPRYSQIAAMAAKISKANKGRRAHNRKSNDESS